MQIELAIARVNRDREQFSEQRTWRRLAALAVAGALLVLATSSLNRLLATGANNRLESKCPRAVVSWDYHRSAWTPLLWSCTTVDLDGRTSTVRSFP